jgi:pimeloyl-ACP methyl ester carboxylesterase
VAFLTIDGCDLHYEVQGSGPTVVLTSGGMSPAGAMLSLAAPLAHRYRVVTWDRPNQGSSQVCFDDVSELDMCARHLRALLEYLGEPTAFLVGASEGTRVNVRAALRYPDMVSGLFLWQISAGETGAPWLRDSYYETYARVAESDGMAGVVRTPWWNERVKFNNTNRDRLLGVDPTVFAARMRGWAAELRGEDAIYGHHDDELRRIACPAWVVEGVDSWHPKSNSQRVAQALSNGRLVPAPYDAAAFDGVKEVHGGLPLVFVRYADLPGILQLLEEFLQERG